MLIGEQRRAHVREIEAKARQALYELAPRLARNLSYAEVYGAILSALEREASRPAHMIRRESQVFGDVYAKGGSYDQATQRLEAIAALKAEPAGAALEREIWPRAIETYFDATAVEDVERYVAQIRAELEGAE